MDTKVLAKSKRAHTQHQGRPGLKRWIYSFWTLGAKWNWTGPAQHHTKKSHPLHKPKGPGVVSEKPQANQTKIPVQSRRVSALPSNWGRYDDEPDLGLLTNQPADVIVPKSKEADYLHLISEANAESRPNDSDCLSSLDDLNDAEAVTTRLNETIQQESSEKIDPVVTQGESSSALKDIRVLTDQPEKSSASEADLDFLLDFFGEEPNPVASASSQNYSVQRSSAFETELDSLLSSHGGGAEPLHRPANHSDQKLNTTD
ncbi:hypothetical protein Bca101_064892 [Brassica carinata]